MADRVIANADARAETKAAETALACLEAGIEAAHPRNVVPDSLSLDRDELRVDGTAYSLAEYDEVIVLGGGKAAGTAAAALRSVLGDRIDRGIVVTNHPVDVPGIDVIEGDHPVPSERGVEGTRRVLELAADADEDALVLAVVTGGGSALLSAPAAGISLADLQQVTDDLLDSGAAIDEINAVRKHCSRIKGGQLARAIAPATVVGLVFSDVVGDDLGVIASGPTAPDESTVADAVSVLDRYGVDPPGALREHLEGGTAGDVEETPAPEDPVFDRVENYVLANGFTALEAARETASKRGYRSLILSSRIRGEARSAALGHVAIAEEALASGNPIEPPAVVLSGGETTVTVDGDGTGGPNQEFALAAAVDLPESVTLASVDSDGEDGATEAAGAIVDAGTVQTPAEARAALDANDSSPYLADRDALIHTGRTGTNVNDLRVVVIA